MTASKKAVGKLGPALVLIRDFRRTLARAGVRGEMLASLDDAIEILRESRGTGGPQRRRETASAKSKAADLVDVSLLSNAEILAIANNPATDRQTLEEIAIKRFGVPRGSMRSYSSMNLLVEKIVTLIRNESTHSTISSVSYKSRS